MTKLTDRGKAFRSAIAAFIDGRREAKLKGKEDDADTASKYDYPTWLADAARRVGQIQAVTHVLKATHPDARGTSLHVKPETLHPHAEIGSHTLAEAFAEDVVGNAAALDVFKFLKLEVDGRKLLDWMQQSDADLLAALDSDPDTAKEWAAAFGGLVRASAKAASHVNAKQLYWLTGDDPANNHQYHLLQPLFSSSLAHAVHADIQDVRFGEANKLARQARRNGDASESGYRDYRGLVVRKLGGTKPQNISQLNSERGGVNYLLASLPPRWRDDNTPKLLAVDSALERFAAFEEVRPLVKQLADFLLTDPPKTVETRQKRETMERALGQLLAVFGISAQAQMTPGWTRDNDCRLPLCEQLWLDQERIELPPREDAQGHQQDADFIAAYEWGDWPDEVAGRFANWLNKRLRDAGLTTVGDAEYKHWAKQAIIDAAWPVPMQRRAAGGEA
jgi:CRISPR-associated protein Csy1